MATKSHNAGIYPMYLTEKVIRGEDGIQKELELTLYSINEISVGDRYEHIRNGNWFSVKEVKETREAKGNHPQPTQWYHIILSR